MRRTCRRVLRVESTELRVALWGQTHSASGTSSNLGIRTHGALFLSNPNQMHVACACVDKTLNHCNEDEFHMFACVPRSRQVQTQEHLMRESRLTRILLHGHNCTHQSACATGATGCLCSLQGMEAMATFAPAPIVSMNDVNNHNPSPTVKMSLLPSLFSDHMRLRPQAVTATALSCMRSYSSTQLFCALNRYGKRAQ